VEKHHRTLPLMQQMKNVFLEALRRAAHTFPGAMKLVKRRFISFHGRGEKRKKRRWGVQNGSQNTERREREM